MYGEAEEDIYVVQPLGLEDESKRVCKLQKALYGLKQAPCVGSKKVEKLLKNYGYIPFGSDSSVYHRPYQKIVSANYVDDVLIASSSRHEIFRAKSILRSNFRMVELGPCTFCLGMTVTRDWSQRKLQPSQPAYLEPVLKERGVWECKPVVVPMDTHLSVTETGYEATNAFRTQNQSAVGSLMYTMLGTRPDIAYSVSVVSCYSSNPDLGRWQVVKKIFRYLRGTINLN